MVATEDRPSRHPGGASPGMPLAGGQDPVENNNRGAVSFITLPKILALLLIPVLLYLIFVAGKWGLADVYSRPAINQLTAWQRGDRKLSDQDWERYAAELQKALRLDPDNPDILEWLGVAVEGPFIRFAPNYPFAYNQRHAAADYYRKSIRLRPTWPYTWAYLALVKYRLDEIDSEFYNALHMAVHYGPGQAGIQSDVSELGMLLWSHLPVSEQTFVLGVMRNGLRHANKARVRKLMALIKRRGFLPQACGRFKDNAAFQAYCKKNLDS